MKSCLLALLLIAFFPGIALAHPPRPSEPSCGLAHVDVQNGDHCLAGSILLTDGTFMAVQPQHGTLRLVMSDKDTVQETSSGAAALEGLVEGDFVCVVGYQQDGVMMADAVTFDVRPFSCS
jgi:hypothetical protein